MTRETLEFILGKKFWSMRCIDNRTANLFAAHRIDQGRTAVVYREDSDWIVAWGETTRP